MRRWGARFEAPTADSVTWSHKRTDATTGELHSAISGRHNAFDMRLSDEKVLTLADLANDALALNKAALAGDYDEARFRAQMITEKAMTAGYDALASAAATAHRSLGAVGTTPEAGFGYGILNIAEQIGALVERQSARRLP